METLNFGVIAYTWITYSITLVCLLYIPSKLDSGTNLMGCLLLSLIGPIIWPLALVAAAITFFRTPKT
jgi:hypothetical protein